MAHVYLLSGVHAVLTTDLACILHWMSRLFKQLLLIATGLLPSDNGSVSALSEPPKPAPSTLAGPNDERVATSAKPAAPAKPDAGQKVCLACLASSNHKPGSPCHRHWGNAEKLSANCGASVPVYLH